jgi:hypothetical protein
MGNSPSSKHAASPKKSPNQKATSGKNAHSPKTPTIFRSAEEKPDTNKKPNNNNNKFEDNSVQDFEEWDETECDNSKENQPGSKTKKVDAKLDESPTGISQQNGWVEKPNNETTPSVKKNSGMRINKNYCLNNLVLL